MVVSKHSCMLKLTLALLAIILTLAIIIIVLQFNYCDNFQEFIDSLIHDNDDGSNESSSDHVSPDQKIGVIVGGDKADPNFWNFIAAIFLFNNTINGLNAICGGSLISDQHVLTAAHCVWHRRDRRSRPRLRSPEELRVRLGPHRIDDNNNSLTYAMVETIYVTEKPFDYVTHQNDIAIIKLRDKVQLSSKISTIALPVNRTAHEYAMTDDDLPLAKAAGWGQIGGMMYTNDLLETRLEITPHNECRTAWLNREKNNRHKPVDITDQQLCTYTPKDSKNLTDTCKGDSGGPLVQLDTNTNQYVLTGIVNFGSDVCADPNLPGIYARVEYFLDWIQSKIQS